MPPYPNPNARWDALVEAKSRENWFASAWIELLDSEDDEDSPLTGEVDLGTSVDPSTGLAEGRAIFRFSASSAAHAAEVARRVVEEALSARTPTARDNAFPDLAVNVFIADRDWDEAVEAILADLEEW